MPAYPAKLDKPENARLVAYKRTVGKYIATRFNYVLI